MSVPQSMDSNAQEAIDLLKQLIQFPSLSREEDKTADFIQNFLSSIISSLSVFTGTLRSSRNN